MAGNIHRGQDFGIAHGKGGGGEVIVFIGMETSGALRRRFQDAGHYVISCDTLPSEDGSVFNMESGGHIQGDVFDALDMLFGEGVAIDLAIFHPTCTYLTNSAAWAFNEPNYDRYPGVGYHQKIKEGTLTGAARHKARADALNEVRRIMHLPIPRKVIENPIGAIGTAIRKPSQIIQPFQFGDDASKGTCLWFLDKDGNPLPDMKLPLDPALRVPGRLVAHIDGKWVPYTGEGKPVERWSNQTNSGQNCLSPGDDRWKDRSRTFPGVADAMVRAWA